MTGKETWDLIAPYINPNKHEELNNREMAEAFIITFMALQDYHVREEESLGKEYKGGLSE